MRARKAKSVSNPALFQDLVEFVLWRDSQISDVLRFV